jgi:phosphatidylglycerophosphate synthase
VGLGAAGWAVGLSVGAVTVALLVRALARRGTGGLGPADWVTLARATLVGAVAALVADSLVRHPGSASHATLVGLAAVALVLDSVDGRVARRTGTVSPLGARFDLEVDAFLILVLSVRVADDGPVWVLAIGAARYLFVAAGWVLPWLRRAAPPRRWCKVVAAMQGIVLASAVAGVLPPAVTDAALLVSLAILAESFGREAWWLWRNRATAPRRQRRPLPRWAGLAVTSGAFLLVWAVLAAPDDVRSGLGLGSFTWLPAEGLVLAALVLAVPVRVRPWLAVGSGLLLGLLALLKALDVAFLQALGRPFDPVVDLSYVGSAVGLLGDSLGGIGAAAVVVAAVALAAGAMVVLPLAVLRLAWRAPDNRTGSARAAVGFAVVWVLAGSLGLLGPAGTGAPGTAMASWADTRLAQVHVGQARAAVVERAAFEAAAAHDPYRDVPGARLLTALRGKDVLLVFVESYGRVALEGLPGSGRVKAAVDAGTARLTAAGYSSRSAFLTSPTFGGISWLAHSTLQSGLWVNSQERYDQVLADPRVTLSGAFHRAGWRTVADVPANRWDWPEGRAFYGFDQVYDSRNVGYAGPAFGYATMPDQFTLATLQRLELAPSPRAPVMAEVDLVTSHLPWAPLPRLVDWSAVGDGSVFVPMPAQGSRPDVVWRHPASVREAYTDSIVYSLDTLVSFLQQSSDPNLVLVVLGDHQPATMVSGLGASHDVPVSVIARDSAVTDRIAGWGWQDGLRPDPTAPVWRMDAFRDRFLAAYGPQPRVSAVVSSR